MKIKKIISLTIVFTIMSLSMSICFASYQKDNSRAELEYVCDDRGLTDTSSTQIILPSSMLTESNSTSSYNLPYKKLSKQELIDVMNLSEEYAEKLTNIQRILDQMEVYGQKIEQIDNKFVITKPLLSEESISEKDKRFIINAFEDAANKNKKFVSQKEIEKTMYNLIKENPYRSEYKHTFDDGTTVVVEQKVNNMSKILDDKIRLYSTVETGTIDIYGENGFRQREFTWNQSNVLYSYYQKMIYNYSVQNSNHDVYLHSVIGAAGGAGVFTATSEGAGVDVSETHYDGNPTIWTQGHSSYQWISSASVGLTCGVFNINVQYNVFWTQIQQVAISLVYAHEYCTY